MNEYYAAGVEDNKTGNVRVNVNLRRFRVTTLALEKQ